MAPEGVRHAGLASDPACGVQDMRVTSAFDWAAWSRERLLRVEQGLMRWVPLDAPARLGEAMRYAVLDGGKRLRPLLVLAAHEAVRSAPQPDEAALRAACAVELVHAYSLVHDDMPCMDDDVLRRGKPTVHVHFGEASALLAGDAMQALAFELLTPDVPPSSMSEVLQARLCRLLARAAGSQGMAGGQAIDLAHVGQSMDEDSLRQMHSLKTGALLQASVLMGAACAGASAAVVQALERYGSAIGLAFQVIDDILDVIADSATLGKTAGKDADHNKPNYVSLMGLEAARAYAISLYQLACQALAQSGLDDTRALHALADRLVNRAY